MHAERLRDPCVMYAPAHVLIQDRSGAVLARIGGSRGGGPDGWPLDMVAGVAVGSVGDPSDLSKLAFKIAKACPRHTWLVSAMHDTGDTRHSYTLTLDDTGTVTEVAVTVLGVPLYRGQARGYVEAVLRVQGDHPGRNVPWHEVAAAHQPAGIRP